MAIVTSMISRRILLKQALSFLGMAALPLPCRAQKSGITKPAMYAIKEKNAVRCILCPNRCLIKPGATSLCRPRKNSDNTLITLGYANPCAISVDPIEKKTLYHVLPGAITKQ